MLESFSERKLKEAAVAAVVELHESFRYFDLASRATSFQPVDWSQSKQEGVNSNGVDESVSSSAGVDASVLRRQVQGESGEISTQQSQGVATGGEDAKSELTDRCRGSRMKLGRSKNFWQAWIAQCSTLSSMHIWQDAAEQVIECTVGSKLGRFRLWDERKIYPIVRYYIFCLFKELEARDPRLRVAYAVSNQTALKAIYRDARNRQMSFARPGLTLCKVIYLNISLFLLKQNHGGAWRMLEKSWASLKFSRQAATPESLKALDNCHLYTSEYLRLHCENIMRPPSNDSISDSPSHGKFRKHSASEIDGKRTELLRDTCDMITWIQGKIERSTDGAELEKGEQIAEFSYCSRYEVLSTCGSREKRPHYACWSLESKRRRLSFRDISMACAHKENNSEKEPEVIRCIEERRWARSKHVCIQRDIEQMSSHLKLIPFPSERTEKNAERERKSSRPEMCAKSSPLSQMTETNTPQAELHGAQRSIIRENGGKLEALGNQGESFESDLTREESCLGFNKDAQYLVGRSPRSHSFGSNLSCIGARQSESKADDADNANQARFIDYAAIQDDTESESDSICDSINSVVPNDCEAKYCIASNLHARQLPHGDHQSEFGLSSKTNNYTSCFVEVARGRLPVLGEGRNCANVLSRQVKHRSNQSSNSTSADKDDCSLASSDPEDTGNTSRGETNGSNENELQLNFQQEAAQFLSAEDVSSSHGKHPLQSCSALKTVHVNEHAADSPGVGRIAGTNCQTKKKWLLWLAEHTDMSKFTRWQNAAKRILSCLRGVTRASTAIVGEKMLSYSKIFVQSVLSNLEQADSRIHSSLSSVRSLCKASYRDLKRRYLKSDGTGVSLLKVMLLHVYMTAWCEDHHRTQSYLERALSGLKVSVQAVSAGSECLFVLHNCVKALQMYAEILLAKGFKSSSIPSPKYSEDELEKTDDICRPHCLRQKLNDTFEEWIRWISLP